jgi:hypothetical protein
MSTRAISCVKRIATLAVAISFFTLATPNFAFHKDHLIQYKHLCSTCCWGLGENVANATYDWWLGQAPYAYFYEDQTTSAWNLVECGLDYLQPMQMYYDVDGGILEGHGNIDACGIEG